MHSSFVYKLCMLTFMWQVFLCSMNIFIYLLFSNLVSTCDHLTYSIKSECLHCLEMRCRVNVLQRKICLHLSEVSLKVHKSDFNKLTIHVLRNLTVLLRNQSFSLIQSERSIATLVTVMCTETSETLPVTLSNTSGGKCNIH